jgi:FimV-like protein
MGDLYRLVFLGLAISWLGAQAAGLGSIEVQSGLGQPLRARVPLLNTDADIMSRCVRARVETLDGGLIQAPRIELVRDGDSESLRITTSRAVNEPALNVFIRVECGNPVQRTFPVLLDPVTRFSGERPVAMPAVARPADTAPVAFSPAPERRPATVESARRKRPPRRRREKEAPTIPPSHGKAHHKAPAAPRSVLRLSSDDDAPRLVGAELELQLSTVLSTLPAESMLRNPEAIREEKKKLAAATSEEEIAHSARFLIKALQAEVESLRIETERIKQQSLTEKAAMASARDTSVNWVIGLGGLIAACLGAIVWLLWRFVTMQKSAPQIPWNEFDAPEEMGTTGFHTSMFSTTVAVDHDPASTFMRHDRNEHVTEETGIAETAQNVPAQSTIYRHTGLAPYIYTNATETARTGPAEALRAEEISDVMELVDAWTALNEPHKVLELLKPFSEVDHPQSPLPWICLLDVYRALGDREKYESIHRRIRKLYNVRLTGWEERTPQGAPKTLADFPHVTERIMALWESDDIKAYLDSLLHDHRDGTRDGFDLPVYRDILKLLALLDDPACRANRKVMDKRVYAILFSPPVPAAAASVPQTGRADMAQDDANANQSALVRMRTRPKYITPSYERTLRKRGGAGKADDSPAAPAAPEMQPEMKDAGEPVAIAGITDPEDEVAACIDNAIESSARAVRSAHESDLVVAVAHPETPDESGHDDMSPMSIKLHLALAYCDIGDREGASILLEEVIESGDAEQSAQARTMLQQLA